MSGRARRLTRAERLLARRARTRRRARRTTKMIAIAIAVAGVVTTSGIAYWTAGASGSGNGAAGGLAAPSNVTGVAANTSVHVTWTGVTPPGPGTFGYYVERFSSVDGYTVPVPAAGTCSSSPLALLPPGTTSCDDVAPGAGSYSYRVTAVFRTWTALSAVSTVVDVRVLDHFVVSAPASTTAGAAVTLTVTAIDDLGATVTNYVGTVHFQSDDGQATLPTDYTFTSGDAGVHIFTSGMVLRTAGAKSVTVNDTVLVSATGSATITVNPGPLDHFDMTAPATATAGTAFNTMTVTPRDAYGNLPTGWASTTQCVTFSGAANAPNGTVPIYPAPGTCAAGQSQLSFDASGTASGFGITLFKAASTTLTVTAAGKTGTSTVNVVAATAGGIIFTGASNRNGPVTVTCTGPIINLVCTPSSGNGNGNGRFFRASVSLVDPYLNTAINTTGGPLTITLTRVGGTSLSPTSLTINANQSTTTASFVLGNLQNGNSPMTITATTTLNATTATVTLTTT
jgi:hypothetical protein